VAVFHAHHALGAAVRYIGKNRKIGFEAGFGFVLASAVIHIDDGDVLWAGRSFVQ
jgi:hypothetical protein